MFYAHYVLAKKGPLARIWLAAHWDKKLTRTNVFDTNISASVEEILKPNMKIALRTSGHLLLGVVRIYSRQAKYLLADCNEAFVKIKMAFRPGADLVDEAIRDNPIAAITLQESINDLESTLAELHEDVDGYAAIAVNQSRPEDITMREEFGEPNLGRPDDDFGDSTFEDVPDHDYVEVGERDFAAVAAADEAMELDNTVLGTLQQDIGRAAGFVEMPSSVGGPINDVNDDFGDFSDVDVEYDDDNAGAIFEQTTHNDAGQQLQSFSGVDSALLNASEEQQTIIEVAIGSNLPPVVEEEDAVEQPRASTVDRRSTTDVGFHSLFMESLSSIKDHDQTVTNASAAGHIDEPTSPLPPTIRLQPLIDVRPEHRRGIKRRRKLLIDEHKSIPSDVMKLQMQDTSDITTRLDLAPPTRKLMLWKETGSVDVLLTTPGRMIPSRILQKLFYRNLKTRPVPNESPDGLPILRNSQQQPPDASLTTSHIREVEGGYQQEAQPQPQPQPQSQPHNISAPIYDIPEEEPATPTGGAYSAYSASFDNAVTPHSDYLDVQDASSVEHLRDRTDDIEDHLVTSGVEMNSIVGSSQVDTTIHDEPKAVATVSVDVVPSSLVEQVIASPPIVTEVVEDNAKSQLQNAMQILDNELDIVDEEFAQPENAQDRLEKRSEVMLGVLLRTFEQQQEVVFQDLTVSNNKKQAASKFYTLLLLGRQNKIRLHQDTPLSNIIITPY